MYHIYIDDILNYIQKKNLKVNNYRNKLFEISYKSFIAGNSKICEKCKGEMNHNLICNNCPDYILINCVWRESNPIVDDDLTLFFMMPLRDEFNNLFIHKTKTYKKNFYYLFLATLFCMTSLSVSSCTKDEVNEQTELVVKDATNHNEALKLEQDYPIENLAFLMKGIFVLEDEQNNITSVMAFDQDSIYIFSCNTCQYKHKKYQLQQNGTILQIDNQKIPIARWAYLNNHNQGIIPLKLTPDNTQYWLAFEKIILGDGNEQQEFDRTQLIAFIRNQKP
jgi:hypothetical protein